MIWPFRRGPARPAARHLLRTPLESRYAVIDTELTGLDERRDSIVSLGGLRLAAGRIDLADRFYEEVRPASELSPASILVHGITPQEVRDRPAIGAVLAGFCGFCGEDVLVGHFIELDLGFLRRELAAAGLPALANPVLDTWQLYDWLSSRMPDDCGPGLPRLQDPRLPELARALGVPCRRSHNALADAFVTAQVFQRMLRRLDRWGIGTTGDLLRIADPARAPGGQGDSAVPLG